jgi:hypothetical protein
MDNRKHVDGCPLSNIRYEFASCGCWYAQAEADALRAEVERLTYDGIHTCHDGCPRLPCVQRREIERLREALRACRRAVAGGKAEPRQTVREIVDQAIEEHDRKTEGKANA